MKPTVSFIFVLLMVFLQACGGSKRFPATPGADIMTPMPSSIPFSNLQTEVIHILADPPIDLTIDSVFNKTVSAYEIYDGRVHRRWFFWKTVWKEKTKYVIMWDQAGDSVLYTLKTATYEAPDVYWEEWIKVEPSVKTKVNMILNKLK